MGDLGWEDLLEKEKAPVFWPGYFDENIKKGCIELLELKINKPFTNKNSSRISNFSINSISTNLESKVLCEGEKKKPTFKFNLIFQIRSKS